MLSRFIGIAGIFIILAACFLLSEKRERINWRLVVLGLFLQALVGFLILKTYPEQIFSAARALFSFIQQFSGKGAQFLFGSLVERNDFVILNMGAVIIFVSSLMAILNYLRIIPIAIYAFARLMQKTLQTSGAEALSATMQVLMGIEAMTALKAVIGRMTRSELFTVMTCFMGTMAGSVMAVYVGVFGANAGHILAASVMNATGAIVLSKLLIPESGIPETQGQMNWRMIVPEDKGVVEAAANGALDGLRLCAAIAAILLAFVSIIYLLNAMLGIISLSFENIGGFLLAPVAFLLGVPWSDCPQAGYLLTLKTVFNEFLAYAELQQMVKGHQLMPRTVMILTYAMGSFANFGSLAILIGGISALAPDRRHEVSALGPKALLAGLLAGFMTAAIAGTMSDY